MLDLWPADIGTAAVTTPVTILKEQATALGNKTKNIVEGEVTPATSETSEKFAYAFNIVGPALGGYRYRLLTIRYPVDEFYPVEILVEPEILRHVPQEFRARLADEPVAGREFARLAGANASAKDKEQFERVLKSVFNAPKTLHVIQAIIAHSTT